MRYERCSLSHLPDLYQAFRSGFADYIVSLDVPYEVFAGRWFQPAWNQLEHSFIAYDGASPIGMILGGIRQYEGLRTMRCGGLCVSPDYRRRGVAHALQLLTPSKVTASTPNNASLEGFLRRQGFVQDSLSQYEMYLPLS
jgi:GNAT superfamily N-acetyltransferase